MLRRDNEFSMISINCLSWYNQACAEEWIAWEEDVDEDGLRLNMPLNLLPFAATMVLHNSRVNETELL